MAARSALAAILVLVWSSPGLTRDLQSADIYSADHPTVQSVDWLGRELEKRTGGRHRIVSLGEESKNSEVFILGQLRNGTLDMARLNVASLSNLVPAAFVPAMPSVFRSTEHMRRVLDGPIGEELLAALDRFELVGLCFYDIGARSFYGTRPVHKAADLNGARVRVPPNAPWVAMLQALGVQPVSMPFERVHVALRNGTIDFADDNWPAFVASRHYEVAPYFNLTRHSMAPGVLVVSKRTWSLLSPADQATFRAVARESVAYNRKLWDDVERSMTRVAAALKVTIVTDVDQDSFVEKITPARDRQMTSPRIAEMIERIAATP
ncbi:MAG: TRAP transporter substrate-binding protein DctP [Reyranella sp.]|nr:TRAP transporter substrate-binding protein DctP [Reyranella sp.]